MKRFPFLELLTFASILSFFQCQTPDSKTTPVTHPALQSLPVPSGLGVNIHFFEGNKKDYSMISGAGVEIVRMDALWEMIEMEKGVYDFTLMDRLVSDLTSGKLRLLCIICYNNPLYDNGLSPFTDEGRTAYARFCEALVSRFAGKGIIWELWNEPNSSNFWKPVSNVDDYMKWCRVVVPAIRKADPKACIVAPATSDFDIPFVEACFEKGLLELVDGISVHPYRNPKRGPETTYNEYENLKVLIDFYKPSGKNIPIISGEWGYSSFFVSHETQGKYLSRQWLNNISSEVPISIWYDWHDDGKDSLNAEHNFGTVNFDYEPKPAYIAMKTLIAQLNGLHYVERLTIKNTDDYALLFSNGKEFKLVLWTTGMAHSVQLEGINIGSIVDQNGKSAQLNGDYSIQVTDSPIYCSVVDPVPDYFKMLDNTQILRKKELTDAVKFLTGQSTIGNDFADSLKNMAKNGSKAEKMAAFQIIVRMAQLVEGKDTSAFILYDKILNSDATDRSKKQALYRLAVLGSEASSSMVEPFLQIPEFSQAASVYYLQAAYKFAGEKRFQEALNTMFKGTKATGLRYGAERILRKMKEMGWKEELAPKEMAKINGFVNNWNLAGPFPNNDTPEKQSNWFPEKGYNSVQTQQVDTLLAKWVNVDVDNMWGIVPLAKMFGKHKLAVYAYKEIELAADLETIFKIGVNEGIICWVNGEKVHQNFVDRSLTVDEDQIKVSLKKGKNKILLKVLNSGGNWEFCLRVCDKNGVPIENLN